jgi:hypothetical protein
VHVTEVEVSVDDLAAPDSWAPGIAQNSSPPT